MNNMLKLCTLTGLLMLCSCGTRIIDEKYAASVVKDKLSLSGDVTAQKLKGGYTGAQLFLATSDSQNYVLRFITHKSLEDRQEEIYNLKIASQEGYGPHIYFADPSQGIVIMEYLSGKKISSHDLQSDQFYVALAHLLQKIHQGQAFRGEDGVFSKRINNGLQRNKPKCNDDVPLIKIKKIFDIIQQAILPHLTTAPCHNDLHGGNLVFLGNECRAIDYEDAGQNDPYFDVATIAAFFCFEPAHEEVLFTTYLNRQPSAIEKAKLYLIKQVVLIKWTLDALNRLSAENITQYGLIKEAPSIKDFVRDSLDGKLDLSIPENNLKLLKTLLTNIFDNFESQEFHDAVKVLAGI